MSDAREALVALLHNEGDGGIWEHFDRKNSEAVADAILAAGWTPPGERVKPSEDDQWWESLVEAPCDRGHVVFIDDGDGGVYACPVCRLSELRAEVERLREVSAAQPYETERELAVALDEAQRQLADLRAFASWLVSLDDDNPDSPGRQERRTVTLSQIIDRARVTLAGSGEQPGKSERDATPDEAHDIGYAKGHTDGYREALAEHPAPVVPDSTDVRGELLHVLDSHGIDTYIDGTGAEVGVQNLITDILAVVGQGVAEEIERLRDALTDDPDRAALELIVEDAARIARGEG